MDDHTFIGENLIVRPSGELDLQVADDLRTQWHKWLTMPGVRNLVINLSEVSFIDSSGLGVILGRYRWVQAHGGSMALVNAGNAVRRILELAGLHKLARFYDSEQEALVELAGGNKE